MKHYFSSTASIPTLIIWVLAVSLPLQVFAQQPRKDPQRPQRATPTVRFTSGDRALKLPLDIDNGIIRIQVSVNGSKPLKFIFDTGASASFISSQRAAALGLKPQGEFHGNATGGK